MAYTSDDAGSAIHESLPPLQMGSKLLPHMRTLFMMLAALCGAASLTLAYQLPIAAAIALLAIMLGCAYFYAEAPSRSEKPASSILDRFFLIASVCMAASLLIRDDVRWHSTATACALLFFFIGKRFEEKVLAQRSTGFSIG